MNLQRLCRCGNHPLVCTDGNEDGHNWNSPYLDDEGDLCLGYRCSICDARCMPNANRRPASTGPRLNYRQSDVLRRVHAISLELGGEGWVAAPLVGSRTSLNDLAAKGLLEKREVPSPQSQRWEFRPARLEEDS